MVGANHSQRVSILAYADLAHADGTGFDVQPNSRARPANLEDRPTIAKGIFTSLNDQDGMRATADDQLDNAAGEIDVLLTRAVDPDSSLGSWRGDHRDVLV